LFIASICLLAAVTTASRADAQLQKGLFAGWNQTTWTGHVPDLPKESYDSKTGYCFGAFLGDSLTGNFGWRAEILYSRKGAKTVQTGTDENGSATGDVDYFFNVDYLEIPALLTFSIPMRRKVTPVLSLGPAMGFELSSKLDARYPSGVKYAYADDSGLADTVSPDFSMVFAGGVDIDAGTTVVNVQVRYVMGLTEVYEASKNRTLTIMAGIGI
jgi:hypothetical protein